MLDLIGVTVRISNMAVIVNDDKTSINRWSEIVLTKNRTD